MSSLERYVILTWTELIYTPLLCTLGLIGNCLSLAVFCFHFNHKNLSSSYYLATLAVTDNGVLLGVFLNWLDHWWSLGITTTSFSCPLIMYLFHVMSFLSVWLIVAFTVERYFAVCHPMSYNSKLSSVRKVKRIIFVLVIFTMVLYSYILIIAKPERVFACEDEDNMFVDFNGSDYKAGVSTHDSFDYPYGEDESYVHSHSFTLDYSNHANTTKCVRNETLHFCTVPLHFVAFNAVASYIDTLITLVFPFIIIAVLNTKIILTVWNMSDQMGAHTVVSKDQKHKTIVFRYHSSTLKKEPKSGGLEVETTMPVSAFKSIKHKWKCPSSQSVDEEGHHFNNWSESQETCCATDINHIETGRLESRTDTETCVSGTNDEIDDVASGSEINTPVGKRRKKYNVMKSNSSRNMTRNENPDSPSHNLCSTFPPTMELRVTKILLLVSTAFLVLNLPSHVVRGISFVMRIMEPVANHPELQIAQQWANQLFYTNFAVNFLLYCASGKTFRKSLRQLCLGKHKKNAYRVVKLRVSRSTMNVSFSSTNLPSTSAIGTLLKMQSVQENPNAVKVSVKKPSVLMEFHEKHCKSIVEDDTNELLPLP